MAIKIIVSNTVKFKVRGTIKDDAGIDQPFDFHLTCMRLDQDQVNDRLRADRDAPIVDFLATVIEDWQGVRDGEDRPLPYCDDALRQLCRIPGLPRVMLSTYLHEIGAKEKN